MLATHRAGSLEAGVQSVRKRNLALSAAILLPLVTSLVFLIVLSQRSRRLARQQMVFVAGVSHEFRTPLAVICSAGDNLADGVVADHEQVKRYGEFIRNEGRRLSAMVDQVMEFSAAQPAQSIADTALINVQQLIESAIERSGLNTPGSGFTAECDVEPNLPQVRGNEAALGGALQNLFQNAIKYSGENRWVGVTARIVPTGAAAELALSVQDRGAGISPYDLPHIFEPFYRGREAADAQIHGNGLGLSLVQRIVEAHGGRVTVQSTPGQGSTFTINLPVEAGQDVSQSAAPETHEQVL